MSEHQEGGFIEKANRLKKMGRLTEAVDVYCEAIQANPSFSWYHYCLAETLVELGLLDEAVTACQKAVELSPNVDLFKMGLAKVLKRQGNLE